jgi:hypothetical protein
MMEARGGLGFPAEAGHRGFRKATTVGENFDSDPAIEALLFGFVDDAHAPTSDFSEESEVA